MMRNPLYGPASCIMLLISAENNEEEWQRQKQKPALD